MIAPARAAATIRRTAAALLASTGFLLACATTAALPRSVMVVDAAWRQQLGIPAVTLPALPGTPPIGSCADLLTALRGGADVAERIESPQFNAYANCVAGAVLEGGAGSNVPSRFKLDQAGAQIVATLDLSTLRSSLAPRRPAPHYFLSDFTFVRSRIGPLSVELASSTFDYRFEVLAEGDFQRRGQPELLVRFSERANAGSYDSVRILVLAWSTDQPVIVAVDALDLLRSRAATPSR